MSSKKKSLHSHPTEPFCTPKGKRVGNEKIERRKLSQQDSSGYRKTIRVYVAMMTVYRWRKKYIAVTGEDIPRWCHLNKTLEQKAKNKSEKREKRSAQK